MVVISHGSLVLIIPFGGCDVIPPQVHLFEFNDKFNLVQKRTESLPGFSFMHDFVVTSRYYVLFQVRFPA